MSIDQLNDRLRAIASFVLSHLGRSTVVLPVCNVEYADAKAIHLINEVLARNILCLKPDCRIDNSVKVVTVNTEDELRELEQHILHWHRSDALHIVGVVLYSKTGHHGRDLPLTLKFAKTARRAPRNITFIVATRQWPHSYDGSLACKYINIARPPIVAESPDYQTLSMLANHAHRNVPIPHNHYSEVRKSAEQLLTMITRQINLKRHGHYHTSLKELTLVPDELVSLCCQDAGYASIITRAINSSVTHKAGDPIATIKILIALLKTTRLQRHKPNSV